MKNRQIIGRVLAILGICCLLVSAIVSIGRSSEVEKLNRAAKDLGSLTDSGDSHAGQMAKIQATGEAHAFANKSNGGNYGYYFVVDEKYNYIIYASERTAAKLDGNGTVELAGVLREFTNQIRSAAIEWMEQADPDRQINTSNFRDYFGGSYLDTTADATALTTELNSVIRISLVAGCIFTLSGIAISNFGTTKSRSSN